jgi:predicted component of type VI protein secretion system
MTDQYNIELTAILLELDKLLPQLKSFIGNFDTTVMKSGINVVTDTAGQLSIDVPSEMSNVDGDNIAKKIRVLDKLIHDRLDNLDNVFKKASTIESHLKNANSNYTSVLTEKSKILTELKKSYKH